MPDLSHSHQLENGLFVVWDQKIPRRCGPQGLSFVDGSYAHVEGDAGFASFKGRGRLAISAAEHYDPLAASGETQFAQRQVVWVDKEGPELDENGNLKFPDGSEIVLGADRQAVEIVFHRLGLLAIEHFPITSAGPSEISGSARLGPQPDALLLTKHLVGAGNQR